MKEGKENDEQRGRRRSKEEERDLLQTIFKEILILFQRVHTCFVVLFATCLTVNTEDLKRLHDIAVTRFI